MVFSTFLCMFGFICVLLESWLRILSRRDMSGNILTCPAGRPLTPLTDPPWLVATFPPLGATGGAPGVARHLLAHLDRNLPADSPHLLSPPRDHRALHRPHLPTLAEHCHNLCEEKLILWCFGFCFLLNPSVSQCITMCQCVTIHLYHNVFLTAGCWQLPCKKGREPAEERLTHTRLLT